MRYCNSDCASYARGPYWCPGRRHKSIKEDGREGLFFVVFKKFIRHSLFREVSQMPETKILYNKCLAQLNQGVNIVLLLYIVANQFFQTRFFAGETALQKG